MTGDNFVNISGGKVQGFIQENHGTVTQTFITQVSESVSRQAPNTENLSREEYQHRAVLISKVKQFWIKNVLEKSLYGESMIELGLEERSDIVEQERPIIGFEESLEDSRQMLSKGTGATEFFDQIGDGRTLLILGEPGSGKTITLLKLAQNLITRAEEDVNRLIPVVFNLSSWGSKQQTIADWLVEELWNKYGVPKTVGKNWVEKQQLILLLDGLDEVKAKLQESCIQAINQFMQDYPLTEVVVCSRIAEYEALSAHLRLRGAVFIRSLTSEQINQYLDKVGGQLQVVKTLLQEDDVWQELARSPLTLSVMTLAYRGKKIEEIPQIGSVEERRYHLFDSYIKRMFIQEKIGKSREYKSPYQNQKTILWLKWLAQRMNKESQTVFLIENLQPRWLKTNLQKSLYVLLAPLFIFSVIAFLEYFTVIPIMLGQMSDSLSNSIANPFGITNRDLFFLVMTSSLFCSSIMALSLMIDKPSKLFFIIKWLENNVVNFDSRLFRDYPHLVGTFSTLKKIVFTSLFTSEIEIVESVRWSLSMAVKTLRITFIRVLLFVAIFITFFMLFVLLISSLSSDKKIENPFMFFSAFFYVGSLFYVSLLNYIFLFSGINIKTFVKKTAVPNEGIWKTVANIVPLSILGFVIGFALSFPVTVLPLLLVVIKQNLTVTVSQLLTGLSMSILMAIMFAVPAGGSCIKHLVLRIILYCNGYIPWNYGSFLNYASDRIFLRKVGGGYIFIHRMLQEHFARMDLL